MLFTYNTSQSSKSNLTQLVKKRHLPPKQSPAKAIVTILDIPIKQKQEYTVYGYIKINYANNVPLALPNLMLEHGERFVDIEVDIKVEGVYDGKLKVDTRDWSEYGVIE